MLRVTTLYACTAATTAEYYTRYLTKADGEQPGVWIGRQADLLGLAGEVTTEDLQALLEGRDPISGTPLGNPLVDRVTSSGKVVHAVAGFDATFSAPKSLSVWWALSGDEGLAVCHDVAVRAVVDAVERYGSTTRVRSNGRRLHPDSHGLTAAVFRQTTSRLDDPQLHSHVVISSKVQTAEGRWLALDARTLKGFQRALGGLYQSVLRAELTARYGVVFGEIDKGQAEIAGVPAELLQRFSKRTEQVERAFQHELADFYAREGRDPTPKERGALGRRAAENTRGHKTSSAIIDLRTRWLTEAAAVGVTPRSLHDSIDQAARSRTAEPQRVVIADVIAAVTERRSAWHRLDLLQAICDTVDPVPGFGGTRWARALGRAVDQVLEHCVDLDPTGDLTRRRDSDGRSLWIEPSARHVTSEEVLAQEAHVLSWAIDAQLDPPANSPTVDTARLDLMQAEAAATVAGRDRLVLVVGPAGAGKTTMLRVAAADLTRQRRPVFGVAPTAKAARVLESETGMTADTVAKLLLEWHRRDRPPDDRWRLPAGTTVVVDEAGMLATGDLYRLTNLADDQTWRLVLVGDPQQLQAVGRGGMFAELCATGRTIELDTIHRFHHSWEAAASLKLRHGDPSGLEPYLDHDRIHSAPLAEHLDNIAHAWAGAHDRGEYLAITTTTNDHVEAINCAVQDHRHYIGQLGSGRLDLGDVSFRVGDVISTRRNERHLHTSTGDTVRNRDYWTIDNITTDGELAVTRIDGHGHVTLPSAYVTEHVQLGYAATEPGNQSDTATASLTLATPATTCRGLYVAVTRGRHENHICVVTDTHDLADAVDVLEQILAADRADTPATTVRRDLTATIPPTPTLQPRCTVPDWFRELHREARSAMADARERVDARVADEARIDQRIAQVDEHLDAIAPVCAPHDRAIARANADLDNARQRRGAAERDLATSKRRHRRAARHEVALATEQVATATAHLDEVTRQAQPHLDSRSQLRSERHDLRRQATTDRQLYRSFFGHHDRLHAAERSVDALDTWRNWAVGLNISTEELHDAITTLHEKGRHEYAALAEPLLDWMDQRGIATPHHGLDPAVPRIEPPGLDIGL